VNSQAKILSNESDDQPLSVPDSPANLTVLQENVKRLVMTVISPGNSKESFGRLNPDGSLLRTSRGYAQANLDGFLESSCMTFPKWGILSDGVVGELRMSEPGIKENESLLLPTPTVADSKSNGTPSQLNRDTVNLNTVVKVIFSTPRASDMENPASKRMSGIDHRHQLREEVRMFPTPAAEDNRDRGNLSMPSIQRRIKLGKQLGLSMVVDQTSGSLNPRWVEWLMGFPHDWTELEPSEMPLSRSKSIRSSKRSQILKGVK